MLGLGLAGERGAGARAESHYVVTQMSAPTDAFRRHLDDPKRDAAVAELRRQLVAVKRDALERSRRGTDHDMRGEVASMYQEIVAKLIGLATHVGVGVACALAAHDELADGGSISRFDRRLRDRLTDVSSHLRRRHSSRLAAVVAEIEAQRLSWRLSHELLSWIAFCRDDDEHPASERLRQCDALKLDARLLHARDTVARYVGAPLCAALEGHDRFMLADRWRLPDDDAAALEGRVWTLLGGQSVYVVRMERARLRHDALVSAEATRADLEASSQDLSIAFADQLAEGLRSTPATIDGPVL